MQEFYLEGSVPTVEDPFIDGGQAQSPYSNRKTEWYTCNDGTHIVLLCPDPNTEDTLFYPYFVDISNIVKSCPTTKEIFATDRDQIHGLSFMIPTVERANRFAAETFDGLSTAGIQAIQTRDIKSTPPDYYVSLLFDEYKLPIAYGHEPYLHDIVGHWLATAAIEEREFAIFKALRGLLPASVLAEVLDSFTEKTLARFIYQNHSSDNDGYLLSHCLNFISDNCPTLVEGAAEIVHDLGAGAAVRNSTGKLVLPWEKQSLSAHYRRAKKRLQGSLKALA